MSMKPWMLLLALATLGTGCTTVALERRTINQAESTADLRYKEVLSNLALIAASHWALPTYSSIYAGTAKVSDQFQATSVSAIAREAITGGGTFTTLDQESLDLQAQRAVSENWTLDPTSAPETLRAMRAAIWWVLCGPESLRPEDVAILDKYQPRFALTDKSLASLRDAGLPEAMLRDLAELKGKGFEGRDRFLEEIQKVNKASQQKPLNNLANIKDARLSNMDQLLVPLESLFKTGPLESYRHLLWRYVEDTNAGYHFDVIKDLMKIPPGWLHVGKCKDVPKNPCYQAHFCGLYVWVMPEGMAGLSAFTLVLHNIDRVDVNSVYYPKPATLTLTKQEEADNGSIITKVTVYVDNQGRPVGGPGQYAFPVKQRVSNVGADQFLRSQITAAQSH